MSAISTILGYKLPVRGIPDGASDDDAADANNWNDKTSRALFPVSDQSNNDARVRGQFGIFTRIRKIDFKY